MALLTTKSYLHEWSMTLRKLIRIGEEGEEVEMVAVYQEVLQIVLDQLLVEQAISFFKFYNLF